MSRIEKHREAILHGPIIRTILILGVPPLINQVISVIYNLADSYWLSKYSEIAVAVPRQMWPVTSLFSAFANGISAACLAIVSQYIGKKDYNNARIAMSRFFTLSFILGTIMSITFLALREFMFGVLMVTPLEIYSDVIAFAGVLSLDIFLGYLVMVLTTIFQSVGDTKRPALINITAVIINIILDPVFIFGISPIPGVGVVGAAITDVIGKIISLILLLRLIKKDYRELNVRFTKDMDKRWAKVVIAISQPIVILGITNSLAFIMQLRLINLFGIIVSAAYAIGFIIMDAVDAALWGLISSPSIMIGQCLGARMDKRAREVGIKASLLVFTLVSFLAFIFYILRGPIISFFVENSGIYEEADFMLQILLPALPFFGLFMIGMSVGRGSGHTTFPTILGLIRLWGLRISLGYLLAFILQLGILGVWLAIALSNLAGLVAFMWVKYGKWTIGVIHKESTKALESGEIDIADESDVVH